MTRFATSSEPKFDKVEVALIDHNPNNPRGIPVREDDRRFLYLRESIAEFDILVPLVVVGPLEDGRYLLIDGERRVEAAKAVGRETVPAYILSQDWDEDHIRRIMFHIHQNREQWNPAQQCRACEPLYEELVKKYGDNFRALAEDFAKITGTPLETSEDRIRFLSWPEEPKNFVYSPENNELYTAVVEIEEHIIQSAKRNYPEYFVRVDVDDVRAYLFWKYADKPVGVRAIRDTAGKIAKSGYTGEDKEKVMEILVQLAEEKDYGFNEAYEDFVAAFPQTVERRLPSPRTLLTNVEKLSELLDEYELDRLETATGRSRVDIDDMVRALRRLAAAAQTMAEQIKGMAQ